jgi:enoyl-[acyl-carrier-protein] reductase (NADH)
MSVGRLGGDTQAFLSKPAPGTVAGRPATGRDLAQSVAVVLSDESEAITGTVIDVGCFAHQGGPLGPKPIQELV